MRSIVDGNEVPLLLELMMIMHKTVTHIGLIVSKGSEMECKRVPPIITQIL